VRRSIRLAAFLLLIPLPGTAQTGETRLLRYPDIHGDTIAFVYAGDIWLAGARGGAARRLTSDPGEELFPKFSPDGHSIAFTGQYTGTRQVYVIGVDGGMPRQLTFHNDVGTMPYRGGVDNHVLDWTPDGKQVLFLAHRTPWSERIARPYLVPAAGGTERPLPLRESSVGSLSADGTRFAFAPVMNEWREWKYYYGGRASDVWIYDLKSGAAQQVTDDPGIDQQPVWIGETLYFASNRDRVINLFAWDPATRATRKATRHDVFDVLWPSGDGRRIVYENGGWIHLFDPATGANAKVPIRVEGDLPRTLPYYKNVTADIDFMTVSPTGKRALLTARGDVFTVPAAKGEIRNLTASPGVREMNAAWSPDGRWIAYLSDRTGEYEIYVRPADGSGQERRVTTDGTIWRFPPQWSPDSKKLTFGDKDRKLQWVDIASGRVKEADRSDRGDITDYRWSPDSRWLAYTKTGESQLPSVWLYALDESKARQLTGDLTAETEPVWDPSGRYLYFLSNRDYNLTFSAYEFDYVYTNPTRVYVGVLAREGPALLLPESDEEKPQAEAPPSACIADAQDAKEAAAGAAAEEKPDAAKKAPVRVKVDFEGFEDRVRALPGPAGNYQSLAVNGEAVFYLFNAGTGPLTLKTFNFGERKEETVLERVVGYDLSADGKKILFRQQGDAYGIADAKAGQKPEGGKLALDTLQVRIEPQAEWRQIYTDAWRTLRDWFYDPAMHGFDWPALRDRYGELLPFVATRADLDFVLAQLGGELSAGHIYVQESNDPGPERVEGGLLGAEIEPHASGFFRVAHIFPGENWHADFRSPLTEPGVHVEEGELILAVDGQATDKVDNFYRLLENKADRVVTLLVNGKPSRGGAREELVRPVKSEQNLRYLDWVQRTRAKVEKAAGGRVGYIHLPNTAAAGNRELFKYFYPLAHKGALILDDRYNGGGFIPDRMISLLSRPLLNYWVNRSGTANPTPGFVNTGPKVTLINGQAGSGGDAFPYYFRKLGLGPLIGETTWGGLIGLTGGPSLVDGGTLTMPTFRFLTTEGEWGVENEGVAPDIEVVDRPDALARGEDPTLEKGIAVLLEALRKDPPKKVTVPPIPKGGAPR
jgi:tricorn protease